MGTQQLGEELRQAIRGGRCTAADLAARSGRTPKTVRTWIAGRAEPRERDHRAIETCAGWKAGRVAELLEQTAPVAGRDYGILELVVVELQRNTDALRQNTEAHRYPVTK